MDSDPPLPLRSMIALEPLDIPAVETELFLRETLPPAPARVLEVGAGDGRLSARLARGGWTVTALDHSEPDVGAALGSGGLAGIYSAAGCRVGSGGAFAVTQYL